MEMDRKIASARWGRAELAAMNTWFKVDTRTRNTTHRSRLSPSGSPRAAALAEVISSSDSYGWRGICLIAFALIILAVVFLWVVSYTGVI